MSDEIHGTERCCCGALVAEARGESSITAICSCSECKPRPRSAFGFSAYWDEDEVTISGVSNSHRPVSQRASGFQHHFHPICGAALWRRGDFSRPLKAALLWVVSPSGTSRRRKSLCGMADDISGSTISTTCRG